MNFRRKDLYIFNIRSGIYLANLIVEGRRKFRLSRAQFAFMAQLSMYKLKKFERGEVKTIFSGDLRSMCNMLDIDFREALETTDCPIDLIDKLVDSMYT